MKYLVLAINLLIYSLIIYKIGFMQAQIIEINRTIRVLNKITKEVKNNINES